MKELHQMLTREVFGKTNQDKLAYNHKKKALPALLFLTLKWGGTTIKGRACADGYPQCIWIDKQDSVSSTIVVLRVLFYTLIMDTMEGRDVASCDLPGYFRKTDMEGYLTSNQQNNDTATRETCLHQALEETPLIQG